MKYETKMVLAVVVLAVLILSPVGQAATIIMDADHHNGSLTAGLAGYWDETPAAIPAGWNEAVSRAYTALTGTNTWIELTSPNGEYNQGTVVNNTGEVVVADQQYTVQADLGGWNPTGNFLYPATVSVYATENADGTGNKAFLVGVTRMGTYDTDGYTLFTVSNTSAGFGSRYAGYYIQVALQNTGFYDNIIVTSAPATADTFMNKTLHNGGFNGAIQGNWTDRYGHPNTAAIPAGWVETSTFMYTLPYGDVSAGSWATAANYTGEVMHAGDAFTISGDLGSQGVGNNAIAKVWATQNANGTGLAVELAEISYIGTGTLGYNLTHVTSPQGDPAGNSLDGFYVTVTIAGNGVGGYYGGFYDNLTVTAEHKTPPANETHYYMNGTFHNGLLATASRPGTWDLPEFHPAEWYLDATRDPNSAYTTTVGWILFSWNAGNQGGAYNNTGQTVPAGEQFKIQADSGGQPGAFANVYAYATQNADGTGTKVLLAQLSRAGDPNGNTPLWMIYPNLVGTPGSVTPSSLAGYYVRVELQTSGDPNVPGFYDNIIVSSQAPADCLYVGRVFQKPVTGGNFTVTQAMYDTWVSLNKPACWCCEAQKYGNADYTGTSIDKVDNKDLTAWKKAYGAYAGDLLYNACADFDLSGKVDNKDLTIFKQNYGTYPGTCQ